MSDIIIAGIIKYSDLQDWIEPSPLTTDLGKLTLITEGVVSEVEEYMDAKIQGVADEVAYLDGGKSYLSLPHLNISDVSVWEDLSRIFDSSTLVDPTKYQVYTERGILRIGKAKNKSMGGLAWMDRYFSDYYWDDYFFDRFFEGRREFLRGRQVIKVQYDGGYDSDTILKSLKMALITEIGFRYRRRKDSGLSTVTYPDGSIVKMAEVKQFLPQLQAVLDKYKRMSI